jgi:nucleotide-binding universal stress UspA family protein
MTITSILVHLDDRPAASARLAAGLDLARAFAAELTALCLVADPFARAMAGKHLPPDLARDHLAQLEQEADALLASARAQAEARGQTIGLARAVGTLDQLPVLLARRARHADLTLVGQADPSTGSADDALLAEAAFMDTGRPALVVPATFTGQLPPRRALLAWDGSREAARAVGDAVPLLQRTDEAVVLIIDADRATSRFSDRPGAGLAGYLSRHGIKPRLKLLASHGRSVPETILDQAREEAADLLVMGGYGHSRFREMMLGGVTRSMLERTTVPVLFSH